MKKIKIDLKKGIVKLKPENLEDLWYLSRIIDKDDFLKGKSDRKIKLGTDNDRNQKVVRKTFFLKIKVEKVEFSESQDILRVSGTISEGPEEVSLGSHHTISIEPFMDILIIKERWLKFHLDIIDEASNINYSNVLMVVMDREEAFFAKLKKSGYEVISSLKGDVKKKGFDENVKGNFNEEIIKAIEEMDKRENYTHIIVASPSFWKEYLIKSVSDESLKKRIIQATCSSVDRNAFDEILKREELKTALKEDKVSKEMKLVEEVLNRISKESNSVYGENEVIEAGKIGAIEVLLLTDKFIQKKREDEDYEKIDRLMKTVDDMKGEIAIISHSHDGGKKLEGLGGIAALTRYKIR